MATYKLKDEHPLAKKVDKVFELMDNLKISFQPDRYGRMNVIDLESNVEVELKEIDSSDDLISILPPVCEYKLVIEK